LRCPVRGAARCGAVGDAAAKAGTNTTGAGGLIRVRREAGLARDAEELR
jgi:hypothetical protein